MALDPALPPSGNFNLTNWNITLPVDSSGGLTGTAITVKTSTLASGYSYAPYFYTATDGAMTFEVPHNGATAGTSSHPRSELRECFPNGSLYNWVANDPTGKVHTLVGTCVPDTASIGTGGYISIGQIHGKEPNIPAIILRYYASGRVAATVKRSPSDPVTQATYEFNSVGSNPIINYTLQIVGDATGKVDAYLTVNGQTVHDPMSAHDPAWATTTFYFKAGLYNVAPVTGKTARLAFYKLVPTHSTVPPSPPVVPSAVQVLLPSVQSAVTNWQEFKPQKITIAPYPDMPIEFTATSIREENGRTVWTGSSAIEGSFLVAAATENDWHATLVIPPTGAFDIHIAGSTVSISEKDLADERCGTQPAMTPKATADTGWSDGDTAGSGIVAAADSTTTVDVLFFYDAATLAQIQNNSADFETRMIAHVAASNVALASSAVTNFRWRYLASYQVPFYTATNDMAHDLRLITGVAADQSSAPNAVSDFVNQKAVLHGADQVVLYVGGPRNYGGIAWAPSGAPPASMPLNFHSAVVAWNTSYAALAHELAHNFGCYHDRQTEGASDNDGHYRYGFRFTRSGQDWGTIMSYADNRVPYFSDPQVTFDGVALGVPENQPKAANNARVLREDAPIMIASRASVEAPAITAQPQSVTINVGQPFTLSVTATGSNLTYQWKMAGIDIAGASGDSYSKTAAAASDAGSYTVTLSNIAGQATSSAVTVTVNASGTPAAPAATPSSGGGGGGGAVDMWFATACGLLLVARSVLKKDRCPVYLRRGTR